MVAFFQLQSTTIYYKPFFGWVVYLKNVSSLNVALMITEKLFTRFMGEKWLQAQELA